MLGQICNHGIESSCLDQQIGIKPIKLSLFIKSPDDAKTNASYAKRVQVID